MLSMPPDEAEPHDADTAARQGQSAPDSAAAGDPGLGPEEASQDGPARGSEGGTEDGAAQRAEQSPRPRVDGALGEQNDEASAEPDRDGGQWQTGRVPTGEAPVVLWLLALLATVAALVSMSVERALPGVWLGVDHVITAVKLGGAVSSQLLAVSSTAVVIGLVLATTKSRLPAHLRAYAVGAGALSILAVMIASAMKLPDTSRLVLGGSVALLGLLAAWPASRVYTLRAAALVVGVVSLGGMVRVATVLLAMVGAATSETLATVARVGASAGVVIELGAIGVALAWLISQPGARGGALVPLRRPRWPLLAALLAVCALLAVGAQIGAQSEARGAAVLLSRSLEQLAVTPAPFVPSMLLGWVEILRWAVVIGLLLVAPRGRMMSSTVALALIARHTVEVPLCAVTLVVAALALGLHPGADLRSERDAPKGGRAAPSR